VLFCDSDPRERRNVLRQVNRMMAFVGQALQDRETPATIAIVFTKFDLVDGHDDELFKPTSTLLKTISTSETVVGTLIPISCGINPTNTELPILFVLHFGILLQALFLAAQIEYFKTIEVQWRSEGNTLGGFFRDLGRALSDKPTSSQRAALAHSLAVSRWQEIEQLLEPGEQLSKYLGDLPVF
jgi:hypothetical protein